MPLRPCLLIGPVLLLIGCGETRGPRQDAKPPPGPGKITITSTPTGAAVLDRGSERMGKTPLTLERPAFTRLELQLVKAGYQTLRLAIIVEPGEHLELHQRLRRAQGHLLVRTGIVRGARLRVNGEEQEKTPCKVEVEAGIPLKVQVDRPGFTPHEEELTLKEGETRELDVYLLPAGQKPIPMGWLTVESSKPALVSLDRKIVLGPTPVTRLRLPARSYEVLVRPPQGAPRTVKVRVRANQEEKLRVEL